MANGEAAFIALRRSGPDAKTLTPVAEAFYKVMPPAEYPGKLIEAFPRIANHIAAVHGNSVVLGRYFESLLVDQRGNRHGFDFGVLVDIQNLFDKLVGIPSGLSSTNALLQTYRKNRIARVYFASSGSAGSVRK